MTDFMFVGGSLALDFVNTELIEPSGRIDLLQSDQSLLAWAQAAGLGASRRGDSRARLDRRTRPLRAALRAIFEARIGRRSAPARHLATLNAILVQPTRGPPLLARQGSYVRARVDPTPAEVLRRVAEDAAAFLVDADPALLRRCGNSGCVLVFYDTSKGHRRRWCSMGVCGNRAKVSRFHERTRRQRSA
jgi:predicted RNA-binding Zn ribbon-like protein